MPQRGAGRGVARLSRLESFGAGMVPEAMAATTEPAHIQGPRIVRMRGCDRSIGPATFLAGFRPCQIATLDGGSDDSRCLATDRSALGVRGFPAPVDGGVASLVDCSPVLSGGRVRFAPEALVLRMPLGILERPLAAGITGTRTAVGVALAHPWTTFADTELIEGKRLPALATLSLHRDLLNRGATSPAVSAARGHFASSIIPFGEW